LITAIGQNAEASIPAVRKILHSNSTLRSDAAHALTAIGPKAFPVLFQALQEKDSRDVLWGMRHYTLLVKSKDDPQVSALLDALQDAHEPLREKLILALVPISSSQPVLNTPKTPKVLAAILARLRISPRDVDLTRCCCALLGSMGPAASPAIPELVKLVDVPLNAQDAIKSLGQIGPKAVPVLTEIANRKDRHLRSGALKQLGIMGPDAQEALPTVFRATLDPDSFVRDAAFPALASISPGDEAALQSLLKALGDPSYFTRARVANLLAAWKPAPRAEVANFLDDKNPAIRKAAVQVLGELGPERDSVAAIVKALRDDQQEVQIQAASVLGKLGSSSDVALPVLRRIAKDKASPHRAAAMYALASFGDAAREAIPDLIEIYQSEDPPHRFTAISAIGKLGPHAKEAVPLLIETLGTTPNEPYILLALAEIGPDAGAAFPLLKKLQLSHNTGLRINAKRAMSKIGRGAVPFLMQELKDTRITTRYDAAYYLGWIGSDAADAVPVLEQALFEKNRIVPAAAAWALSNMGPASKDALMRALQNPEPFVRFHAVVGLGRLGADAKASLPALERLRNDQDLAVRTASGEAIRQILSP